MKDQTETNNQRGRRKSFLPAFFASAFGTAFSRIFGAGRDMAISHFLGASAKADIFFIAFTIPNIFRRFVADEGLTGALIPALSETEAKKGRKESHELSHVIFSFLLVLNAVICSLGIVFAPTLVSIAGPGLINRPDDLALAIVITRWLFPFTFFVSLVSFFEGILNFRGHFFVPKIAPGIVSLAIILSTVFFHDYFSEPLFSLVLGVLVGGFIHCIIHIPLILNRWVLPGIRRKWAHKQFRKFRNEVGKTILIGIFAQINLLAIRALSSLCYSGAVTHYWNANRIIDLSQGIVVVAMGSAILPLIAEAAVLKDWEGVQYNLSRSLQFTSVLLIPIGCFLFLWAVPTISLIFRHGRYSMNDVMQTADILICLIPFFWAVAAINIVKKIYFAVNRRDILLWIAAVSVLLTVGLGYIAVSQFSSIKGLAIALSCATLCQLGFLIFFLGRISEGSLSLWTLVPVLIKISLISTGASLVSVIPMHFGHWQNGPTPGNLAIYLFSGTIMVSVYVLLAAVFKFDEVRMVLQKLQNRTR